MFAADLLRIYILYNYFPISPAVKQSKN
jgi:hypothetical protein